MKNGRVRIMNNAIDTEKYAYNEEIRNKKREELQIGDRFVSDMSADLQSRKIMHI